jgi:hypothetical protein
MDFLMDATATLILTRLALALDWSDDELRAVVQELVRDFTESANG